MASINSTLRLSSFLLRCNLSASPINVARRSFLRRGLPELRFYSVPSARALRSKRRMSPPKAVPRSEGQGDNGSLVVKDGEGGRIVPTELHKEATDAYMAYAMSVLLGRALPDVRDGLKPVHRRIL